MDLARIQREREALEDRLVADISVEVSYLEHLHFTKACEKDDWVDGEQNRSKAKNPF